MKFAIQGKVSGNFNCLSCSQLLEKLVVIKLAAEKMFKLKYSHYNRVPKKNDTECYKW